MDGYFYYEGGILKHHGVLGQSWGERHGPPYPLYRNKGRAIRAARRHQINLNAKAGIASVNATRLIGASDASRSHWKKIANKRLKAAQKNEKEFHKEFGEKKKIQKSSSDIGTSKSRYILRNVGHNIGRNVAARAIGTAAGLGAGVIALKHVPEASSAIDSAANFIRGYNAFSKTTGGAAHEVAKGALLKDTATSVGRAAEAIYPYTEAGYIGGSLGSRIGMSFNDPYSTGKYITDTYKNRYRTNKSK